MEFETLVKLVKEARQADTDTFNEMKQAELKWKEANKVLTERLSVLKGFVEQQTLLTDGVAK